MTHEKLHNAIYFFVLLTIPPNKQDMAVEALNSLVEVASLKSSFGKGQWKSGWTTDSGYGCQQRETFTYKI